MNFGIESTLHPKKRVVGFSFHSLVIITRAMKAMNPSIGYLPLDAWNPFLLPSTKTPRHFGRIPRSPHIESIHQKKDSEPAYCYLRLGSTYVWHG